ncbi:hypothetical protein RQP46_004082 [Phenoliferia psychrophenolica]
MLICILGPPQSGKSSLAEHLVAQHDFTRVHLGSASLPAGAPADALAFASSSEFLDFVTQTWRKNYVTTDIKGRLKLVEFAKRPFVAVVSVQAPLGVRAKLKGLEDPSLDEFVAADDAILYGITPTLAPPATSPEPPSTPKKTQSSLKANEPPSPAPSPSRLSLALPTTPLSDPPEPLLPLLRELSNISLLNPHSTFEPFFSTLSLPTINDSLRPPWDAYFMRLASLASLRSNCMKRRVGCVLVRERRVVSTGYNGTPRGVRNCSEGGCSRCNSHGDGFGTATGCPCLRCAIRIVQSSIEATYKHPTTFVDRVAIELAIYFHDIEYDPVKGAPWNEEESITVWESFVEAAKPSLDHLREAVSALIHSTIAHKLPGSCPTSLAMSDIASFLNLDIAILASPHEEYQKYASDIRAEYVHYDLEAYRAGRVKVLSGFLSRDTLFLGDGMEGQESMARRNLKEEIEGLESGRLP